MHGRRWTRRAILSGLAGTTLPAFGEPGARFPTEMFAYPDPATEFPVLRLTNPSSSSLFPPYCGQPRARQSGSLLYCSDRTGSPQAYLMDRKTGESEQLTEAQALDASSLCLLADERSICYFDGLSLQRTLLPSLRTRVIYRLPEGCEWGRGLSVSADSQHATFVEARGGVSRLRLLAINQQSADTVIEAEAAISDPLPRPRKDAILFRQGSDSLWLVNYNGLGGRRLKVAPGGTGSAHWSSDGRSIYYLNFPPDPRTLNAIREYAPDSDTDQIVSPTSQFVSFSPNEDASVFVGASSSKASPHVLLLLRRTRRELTLCEHRASDAAGVAPFFSADSQRVYFQSDRHGKPALYSLRVDRLVEKTET